jgi:hypothetical protein
VVPHFLYFTDVTLTDTLCRGGLAIIERDRDVTDLRRLDMKLTGGENRLFAIAGSVPR